LCFSRVRQSWRPRHAGKRMGTSASASILKQPCEGARRGAHRSAQGSHRDAQVPTQGHPHRCPEGARSISIDWDMPNNCAPHFLCDQRAPRSRERLHVRAPRTLMPLLARSRCRTDRWPPPSFPPVQLHTPPSPAAPHTRHTTQQSRPELQGDEGQRREREWRERTGADGSGRERTGEEAGTEEGRGREGRGGGGRDRELDRTTVVLPSTGCQGAGQRAWVRVLEQATPRGVHGAHCVGQDGEAAHGYGLRASAGLAAPPGRRQQRGGATQGAAGGAAQRSTRAHVRTRKERSTRTHAEVHTHIRCARTLTRTRARARKAHT
jgi:hypothetical protein